ncbi:hypothetical protein [Curtobacterium sp. BH-2-1-1]|uniref:hypothetical protein n=1 Tax=Curtobacterium sp. BH-2-1-1 TaxID=1905847 RepID=UPI001643328D|nr:hypothetical protein [Curtobacterium sp. BH-2-1-1]
MSTAIRTDHDPDDAAPRFRAVPHARARTVLVTLATLVLATGVVLAVAEALPFLDGWVLPVVLVAVTAVFLAAGRRAAAAGSTGTARAWAGWAGVTGTFAAFGLTNAAGFGGALVAVLLVAVAVNAGVALWFRSPVHLVAVQGTGLVWAVVAHLYGTPPWALLVLSLAGVWWTGAVGASRSVLVSTTVLLPVSVALLVHPLTHGSAAVDAADVAVLTAAVGGAVTWSAVLRQRRPVTTVWSVTLRTAVAVLVAQVLAGAVPAVALALAPAAPWPSVAGAAAVLLTCAAVAVARPVRPGLATVLVLAGLQLAEVVAAVAVGPAAGTLVGTVGLLALVVVSLVRTRGTLRPWTWAAALALPVAACVLLGTPALVTAGVLVVVGGTVAVLVTRQAPPTASGGALR